MHVWRCICSQCDTFSPRASTSAHMYIHTYRHTYTSTPLLHFGAQTQPLKQSLHAHAYTHTYTPILHSSAQTQPLKQNYFMHIHTRIHTHPHLCFTLVHELSHSNDHFMHIHTYTSTPLLHSGAQTQPHERSLLCTAGCCQIPNVWSGERL